MPFVFFLYFFAQLCLVASHRTEYSTEYGSQKPFSNTDSTAEIEFFGLNTFAHLPYINCLTPSLSGGSYDIAILGAPFDTVSFFHSTDLIRNDNIMAL